MTPELTKIEMALIDGIIRRKVEAQNAYNSAEQQLMGFAGRYAEDHPGWVYNITTMAVEPKQL